MTAQILDFSIEFFPRWKRKRKRGGGSICLTRWAATTQTSNAAIADKSLLGRRRRRRRIKFALEFSSDANPWGRIDLTCQVSKNDVERGDEERCCGSIKIGGERGRVGEGFDFDGESGFLFPTNVS